MNNVPISSETMSSSGNIPIDDARIAIKDADAEKRAYATMRLAKTVQNPSLTPKDRAYANQILDVISQDVSELVRRALSITLKNSPFIPKPVVQRLIGDIESIAVPLIRHSPVLDDEDIHLVLNSGIAGKIRAVAARQNLSNRIIMSLIDFGDNDVVRALAANDSVTLSEDAAQAMVATYREDDEIRHSMLNRAAMPMHVVEKLVAASADDIADRLQSKTDLTVLQSERVGQETHQRTMVSLPNDHFSEQTLKDLIVAMKAKGRLTPETVLRALGIGKMGLVHYGMAALSGLSVRKVVLMLHDSGPFALRSICARAGMSVDQTAFAKEAIRIYADLEMTGHKLTAAEFQTRMVERILTLPITLCESDEAYYLAILDNLERQEAFA